LVSDWPSHIVRQTPKVRGHILASRCNTTLRIGVQWQKRNSSRSASQRRTAAASTGWLPQTTWSHRLGHGRSSSGRSKRRRPSWSAPAPGRESQVRKLYPALPPPDWDALPGGDDDTSAWLTAWERKQTAFA